MCGEVKGWDRVQGTPSSSQELGLGQPLPALPRNAGGDDSRPLLLQAGWGHSSSGLEGSHMGEGVALAKGLVFLGVEGLSF